MLAHIPNSVDQERNASNLKLTLTKQRNYLVYDALNSEMQCTENGPLANTEDCERMLGQVVDDVMQVGFTAQGFREEKIKFMKNME